MCVEVKVCGDEDVWKWRYMEMEVYGGGGGWRLT